MIPSDNLTTARTERRRQHDRRSQRVHVAVDRRHDDRRLRGAADPGQEQDEFQRAMEHLCRLVRYPNCRQVLQIAQSIGYRKITTGVSRAPGPNEGAP